MAVSPRLSLAQQNESPDLTANQNASSTQVELTNAIKKHTDIDEKRYRLALFHYFAGDFERALAQVELNQTRYNSSSFKSQLFKAGLEVNLGLNARATQTLTELTNYSRTSKSQATKPLTTKPEQTVATNRDENTTTTKELKLIALLQLAEQYIEQGKFTQAQRSLARIDWLPQSYAAKYGIMNQLAHWPSSAPSLVTAIDDEQAGLVVNQDESQSELADAEHSQSLEQAYLKLNQALIDMQNGDNSSAITKLEQVKNRHWQDEPQGFWQSLFSFAADEYSEDGNLGSGVAYHSQSVHSQMQQQAIVDYATLLQAQAYTLEQDYIQAFELLSDFPGQSPYANSAVFLYAHAASELTGVEHNNRHANRKLAKQMYQLLTEQAPYSDLAYQAYLLQVPLIFRHQYGQSLSDDHTDAQLNSDQLSPRQLNKSQLNPSLTLERIEDAYLAIVQLEYSQNQYTQLIKSLDEFSSAFANSADVLALSSPRPTTLNSDSQIAELGLVSSNSRSPWINKALNSPALKHSFTTLTSMRAISQSVTDLNDQSVWLADTIAMNQKRRQSIITQRANTNYQQLINELNQQVTALTDQVEQAKLAPVKSQTLFANSQQQDWLTRIQRSQLGLTRISQLDGAKDLTDYIDRLKRVQGVLNWQLSQQFPEALWQHQVQAKQLKQAADSLNLQYQSLQKSSANSDTLNQYAQAQRQYQSQIDSLSRQLVTVNQVLQADIKAQVAQFVMMEKQKLESHLLESRHQLASLLEQLTQLEQSLSSHEPDKSHVLENSLSMNETSTFTQAAYRQQVNIKEAQI
ncbi:hypothetical protein EXU30_00560 [Shewanella maritima]|uniref:Tetratricopeptide repeat protein n=1 Tax=Shewanella maritima TaxID=2520507 RepID=A0A411PD29_9GAMM|nr:hypothetical protein [Shewanella maritima]QBF81352.1 hypothetical protein EXU30_00560 [Shewanella maritima]